MPTKKGTKRKANVSSPAKHTLQLSAIEKTQKQILKTQQELLKSINTSDVSELEETEIEKLEQFEDHLKQDLEGSPLRRITYRDVTKGMVGAFIGVVGHFTFVDSVRVVASHSILRSTILMIFSFLLAVAFIYFTGFRKVNDKFVFRFLPVRAIVIYLSSLVTIIMVLLLYGTIDYSMDLAQVYQIVAGVSVIAVLGAGTADLIGTND